MVRLFSSVIVILALLVFSPRVHAGETPGGTALAAQSVSLPEEKSPMMARLYAWVPTLSLSLAGLSVIDTGGGLGSGTWKTSAGYGLMLLGLGVAPSGGQIYAGEPSRIVLRTVLCGVGLLFWDLAGEAGGKEFQVSEPGDSSSSRGSENDFGTMFLTGGLALASTVWVLTLAIKDLWDAPDAARRANQKIANLSLVPVVLPSEGTTQGALGVGLAGRF